MDPTDGEPARQLAHVYWLGGGSGSGKSTIAARLAALHDLRVYSTDDAMSAHVDRTDADESPQLAAFMAMSMDERWIERTPETMLATFHWYRGEGFGLIVEDLLAMAPDRVIAEGFRLLPALVAPIAAPGHAVWLLPTSRFRRSAFESRGSLWTMPERTSAPETALNNLLERDRMFTDLLRDEVTRHGRPFVDVDLGLREDDLVEQVRRTLDLDRPTRG